jgi:4-amino-4-deoxy-L-arabinose transferase-like glycosyltransferase
MTNNEATSGNRFGDRPLLHRILVLLVLLTGLGVRLIDLTEPPLDIHPTRQLHSALMARGMYYSQLTTAPEWMVDTAIRQGKREAVIEPPIMERLTAWGYQLTGGENVWIARLLSSIFWVLAGLALYSLAASLANPGGALVTLAVYLFITYGIQASRTFQPDPLMVSMIIVSWWAFIRWHEQMTWSSAILAGVATGFALFVKNISIFFLLIPFGFVLLGEGWKKTLTNRQVWCIAILSAFPALGYTLYGTYIGGFLSQQFSFRVFPALWVDLPNYSRWFKQVIDTLGLPGLLLALAGVWLFKRNHAFRFVIGGWVGYILYGLTFAYHIGTHDYYQLPFLPLAAVSMAPVFAIVVSQLDQFTLTNKRPILTFTLQVALLAAAFWSGRLVLTGQNYYAEPAFWRALGDRLRDTSVLGLTQDYGYRMAFYGWDSIENWPSTGDLAIRDLAGKGQADPVAVLEKQIAGKHYFLVTWFDEFERQGAVKSYLHSHFQAEQGDGYLLFDLQNPIQ